MHKPTNCPGHWQVGKKNCPELLWEVTVRIGRGLLKRHRGYFALFHLSFSKCTKLHKVAHPVWLDFSIHSTDSKVWLSQIIFSLNPSYHGQWASQTVLPKLFSPSWPSRFQNRLLFSGKEWRRRGNRKPRSFFLNVVSSLLWKGTWLLTQKLSSHDASIQVGFLFISLFYLLTMERIHFSIMSRL